MLSVNLSQFVFKSGKYKVVSYKINKQPQNCLFVVSRVQRVNSFYYFDLVNGQSVHVTDNIKHKLSLKGFGLSRDLLSSSFLGVAASLKSLRAPGVFRLPGVRQQSCPALSAPCRLTIPPSFGWSFLSPMQTSLSRYFCYVPATEILIFL